jgi:hypothetical protein
MKISLQCYLLLILVGISTTCTYAQNWVLDGPDDANQPAFNMNDADLAADKTGGFYLAYADWDNGQYKACVRFWNGSQWGQVGNPYFSGGRIEHIRIALTPNNQPYVVYKDFSAAGKATVKTYVNGSWSNVGSAASAGGAQYPNIAIDGLGVPYIAYADSLQGDKLTIKKWNGSTWDLVGTTGFTPASSSNFKIVFNQANVPFVSTVYYNGTNTVCNIYKLNSGSWSSIGIVGNTYLEYNRSITTTDLAIDANDTLYVAYGDDNNNRLAKVKKFDGSNWLLVGNGSLSPGYATRLHIIVDTINSVYMSCASSYNPSSTTAEYGVVRRFNGTTWNRVGLDSFVLKQKMSLPTMVLDTAGIPALLFIGQEEFRKIQLRKFDGTNWGTILGTTMGITNSPAESFLLFSATTPDGTNAYVTTSKFNNSNFDSSAVLRYDNGAWTLIGKSDAAHWSGLITEIAVHPNGQPWIVVSNFSNSQYSVWRYDGVKWINTNKPGTQSGGPVSLCFDDAGTAYFAHQAYTIGLYTMKYTLSGGWQNIGSPIPSNNSFAFIRMKTDRNGAPHLLGGIHGSQNQYAFGIYRYSNNSWSASSIIGTINSGFGVPAGSTPDFAFDTANQIYTTFLNTSPSRIVVRKHNTLTYNFVDVGSILTATQRGQYPRIQFAPDGTLYLHYSDISVNPLGSTTVQKLDMNNDWVNVGSPSFTKSFTQMPHLFILNNQLMSAYADGALYAYRYNCNQPLTVSQQPVNTPVCVDSNATISVNAIGAASYQWQYFDGIQWRFLDNNAVYGGVQNAALTITGAKFPMNGYQYRCILKNACGLPVITATATLMIETPNLASPSITIVADTNKICAGLPIRIVAQVANPGVIRLYTWKRNGMIIPASNDSILITTTIADGDIITCEYTRTSVCGNAAAIAISNNISFQVASNQASTVTVNANPGTTIPSGQSVTFTANVVNTGINQTYQWFLNTNAVAGEINPSYTTSTLANGDQVYVTVSRMDTCAGVATVSSSPAVISVTTGVKNLEHFNGDLLIFPQPAKNHIMIRSKNALSAGKYVVKLYSLTGTSIFNQEFTIDGLTNDYKINLPEQLSNGFYHLVITNSKSVIGSTISIMR